MLMMVGTARVDTRRGMGVWVIWVNLSAGGRKMDTSAHFLSFIDRVQYSTGMVGDTTVFGGFCVRRTKKTGGLPREPAGACQKSGCGHFFHRLLNV